jgi:DNA-directed RNA polymerase subunit RPC12/RpoP
MDRSKCSVGVYGTIGKPFYQCAQCGAPIVVDAWSELVNELQVRNVWSCDACGYRFESAANFPKVNKAA